MLDMFNDMLPHGYCLQWNQWLMFMHILSDALIGMVYFGIPASSFPLILKIQDKKIRNICILFASFILFCGMTHLMDILNIWAGAYWFEGILKLITAIFSVLAFNKFFPLLNILIDKLNHLSIYEHQQKNPE